mgnify:CR=1 FL=1
MRKLCTRQHFIEYLSYNYVEKQCLLARCLWERKHLDYGKDGHIIPVAENGEMEKGVIEVQVKATDHINRHHTRKGYYFDVDQRDLDWWYDNTQVVFVLVLYDAHNDTAIYLEMGEYMRSGKVLLKEFNKFVRIYFPDGNVFNPQAIDKLKEIKNKLK